MWCTTEWRSSYDKNYREVLHQNTTKLHIYHLRVVIAESFFEVAPIVVNARYFMHNVIPNSHRGCIHVRPESTFYIMILTIVVI